jgi:hypothetical protein
MEYARERFEAYDALLAAGTIDADEHGALAQSMARRVAADTSERATCMHCGKPIERETLRAEGAKWRHANSDRNIGCRAASFTEDGWDESLSRTTTARPN